jgi:hypothetical protein
MSGGYGGSAAPAAGAALTMQQIKDAQDRVYNFSAGPCALPLEVLVSAQNDMLNFGNTGMGIMEMSHRSKPYVAVAEQANKDLRDILAIPDNYKTFYLQGGATMQFAAVPLNMLGEQGAEADYLVTGQWGEKAAKECNKYGKGNVVANTKPTKHTSIPPKSEWKCSDKAKFFHYCMNETVNGVSSKTSLTGHISLQTCPRISCPGQFFLRSTTSSTLASRRILDQRACASALPKRTLWANHCLFAPHTWTGRLAPMQTRCTTHQHATPGI